jgi:hypothetical protein
MRPQYIQNAISDLTCTNINEYPEIKRYAERTIAVYLLAGILEKRMDAGRCTKGIEAKIEALS